MKVLKKVIFVIGLLLLIGGAWLFYLGDQKNSGERNAFSLIKDKVFSVEDQPVNLIICWTPLQMIIAERIMEQNPNEKFHIMLMSYVKNEKFEYYFNRIKSKSDRAYSFYYPEIWNNPEAAYTSLLELKIKSLLLPKIKTIYLSNVDKAEIHTVVSSHPEAQIKTFDDSTANLIKESHLLKNDEPITSKFYKKYLNSTHTAKEIRESSIEHYTIFQNLPNIMEKKGRKLTYLPLFSYHKKGEGLPIKDTIKIILGSPEEEMKKTSEVAAKHFNIRFATLHPRQKYQLEGIKTLESPLIIEDYLLQETAKNPHTQYEIYTFFSGAALTLKDFPRVSVFALKPNSFPKDYWLSPIYSLYEKTGIPIVEFNDK